MSHNPSQNAVMDSLFVDLHDHWASKTQPNRASLLVRGCEHINTFTTSGRFS